MNKISGIVIVVLAATACGKARTIPSLTTTGGLRQVNPCFSTLPAPTGQEVALKDLIGSKDGTWSLQGLVTATRVLDADGTEELVEKASGAQLGMDTPKDELSACRMSTFKSPDLALKIVHRMPETFDAKTGTYDHVVEMETNFTLGVTSKPTESTVKRGIEEKGSVTVQALDQSEVHAFRSAENEIKVYVSRKVDIKDMSRVEVAVATYGLIPTPAPMPSPMPAPSTAPAAVINN